MIISSFIFNVQCTKLLLLYNLTQSIPVLIDIIIYNFNCCISLLFLFLCRTNWVFIQTWLSRFFMPAWFYFHLWDESQWLLDHINEYQHFHNFVYDWLGKLAKIMSVSCFFSFLFKILNFLLFFPHSMSRRWHLHTTHVFYWLETNDAVLMHLMT